MATLIIPEKANTVRQRSPRVGDRVFIHVGNDVEGTIVEERGTIGAYGRLLYRISVDSGEGVILNYEVPASAFRLADHE